ncbi:MAG: molybdopterin dinucleotide binding domain-containing protein [Acidobacteriota bacterium]
MDRRNFFKIISTTGAAAVATSCGPDTGKLIPMLVPEGQIVPGEEQWHPAVCNECAAGCGTLVRVMEGRRVVETKDGPARERLAAVKKIEGNPLDPISGGKLCARGQAVVQALYHPDRLKSARNKSADISWDDAIKQAADAIKSVAPSEVLFLTGAQVGTRSLAIERFMAALKALAPMVCAIDDHQAERAALGGLPVYDVAKATHILSVGADWLGAWTSPVYYTRQYGEFRRGRDTVRGMLVHAESRMSLTAKAADRWLPIQPGTEPQFLSAVIETIKSHKVPEDLAKACGVSVARIREVAEMLSKAPVPLVIGGASIVHSNSVEAIRLAQQLNEQLGVKVAITNAKPTTFSADALAKAKVILVDGANPAYILPGFRASQKIISFSPFIDDTAAMADVILPDHHYLESETALLPSVGPVDAVTVGMPFVRPLHQSRAVEQTLADIAAALELEYEKVTAETVAQPWVTAEQPFSEIARAGGAQKDIAKPVFASVKDASAAPATFSGDAAQFPLNFQAYLSTQFHDGRSAHLPWMQELPDPTSSAMWGLPVEVDPKTAARLSITNGDRVKVESPFGSFEAPAYVHPGAVPGVLSMAIGSGHKNYTRYASHGANPLSILNPASVSPVLTGGTRVRLTRLGEGYLTQYSAKDTEHHKDAHR